MRILAISIFLFSFASVRGQDTITVEECYERAEANYPLVAQRSLIEKTRGYTVENALKGYLPQLTIGGQATYQSDVTQIPVEMPGVEPLSKDQYRIFGEISQNLYHGGTVRQQKRAEEVNAVVETQKLDVDIYQLRDRINDLFFGILLMKEQIAQSELMKNDLSSALKKVQAGIQHGTALRSQGDILQAELLRIDQRIIELQSAEASFREILGMFTDHLVGNSTILAKPEWTTGSDAIRRPELNLFGLQKQGIEANRSLLSARKKPRIELFLQGGYGRPALNMLENSFDFYYVGGIRFNWLLSGYYTFRRENEMLDLRQQSLDVQKETFLFNTNLTRNQHDAEIAKLQRLIQVDDEIIVLRMRVMETATAQLEEGVISANDYIREVNAADQAKQNRALHEAQRLIAQAKYRFTTGQ
ncbi:MAG: TolC family protein [Cyclobacteriaceae bacterium]